MFDGHGRIGETVSQFVIDTLPAVLAAHPLVHSRPGTALEEAFQTVDQQLATHCDAGVRLPSAATCNLQPSRPPEAVAPALTVTTPHPSP